MEETGWHDRPRTGMPSHHQRCQTVDVVTTDALLAELIAIADLPAVMATERLSGQGFEHDIHLVRLVDGRRLILRRRAQPGVPDTAWARFLTDHGVPAPALVSANEHASLLAYVPGETLSELFESGRCTDDVWQSVGTAFRQVHAVRFPRGLHGRRSADRLELHIGDPVQALHTRVARAEPTLRRPVPSATDSVDRLHALIDHAAGPLRDAPAALLHGDVNLANIIISAGRTVLIDWDGPQVGDPAQEIAALEEHLYLAGGDALPPAFFQGYGTGKVEPNVSVHRIVGAIGWLAQPDWEDWAAAPDLHPSMKDRAARWHAALVDYVRQHPVWDGDLTGTRPGGRGTGDV